MKSFSNNRIAGPIFLMAALVAVAISCKEATPSVESTSTIRVDYKEDASINGDFEMQNGILHFRSLSSYLAILEKVGKQTMDDRLKFAKTLGFHSLFEAQSDFSNKMEKAQNEVEANNIAEEYADIVSLDEQRLYRFINPDAVSATLTNRDGLVFIGKGLRQYKGLEQLNVPSGDIKLLTSNDPKQVSKFTYMVLMGKDNPKNARPSDCTAFNQEKLNGSTSSNSDRKIYLEVYTKAEMLPEGTVKVWPYSLGTPYKKNFWGDWVTYKTTNDLRCRWTCSIWYGTSSGTSTADYGYTNYWSRIDYDGSSVTIGGAPTPSSVSVSFHFNWPYGGYFNTAFSPPGIVTNC